jgi:hypothetical protein
MRSAPRISRCRQHSKLGGRRAALLLQVPRAQDRALGPATAADDRCFSTILRHTLTSAASLSPTGNLTCLSQRPLAEGSHAINLDGCSRDNCPTGLAGAGRLRRVGGRRRWRHHPWSPGIKPVMLGIAAEHRADYAKTARITSMHRGVRRLYRLPVQVRAADAGTRGRLPVGFVALV